MERTRSGRSGLTAAVSGVSASCHAGNACTAATNVMIGCVRAVVSASMIVSVLDRDAVSTRR